MEALTTGSAERVWRRWVLLSLAQRLPRGESVDPVDVPLDIEGRLARMRRTAGQRLVLWAADPQRPLDQATLGDAVPDWAVGDAQIGHFIAAGASFVGWFARDGWEFVPPMLSPRAQRAFAMIHDDTATAVALRSMLTQAPAQAAAVALAHPDLDSLTNLFGPGLGRAAALTFAELIGSGPVLSAAAAQHLLDVVRAQMRQAHELPSRSTGGGRPRLLRQWAGVHLGQVPVRFSVYADDHGFHEGIGTRGLTGVATLSLTNVLRELRQNGDPRHGRWLFAQVTSEGRSIRLERAYDHWPAWFTPTLGDRVPSFGALTREMDSRDPRWRPAWTSLLPS